MEHFEAINKEGIQPKHIEPIDKMRERWNVVNSNSIMKVGMLRKNEYGHFGVLCIVLLYTKQVMQFLESDSLKFFG